MNIFDEDISNLSDVTDEELLQQADEAEEAEFNKERFTLLSEEELDNLISSAEAKGTKRATKWIVKVIEGKFIWSK